MKAGIQIRDSGKDDGPALARLYPAAFPDEDLAPLVNDLLAETGGVLSLVADIEGEIVGHIAFTHCALEQTMASLALLGPLAIAPDVQRQGIGSALIRAGFERLKDNKTAAVLVLGDPAYYSHFGFQSEEKITPPYPLPKEWRVAWQSLFFSKEAELWAV